VRPHFTEGVGEIIEEIAFGQHVNCANGCGRRPARYRFIATSSDLPAAVLRQNPAARLLTCTSLETSAG
jgi:hypothetical protein